MEIKTVSIIGLGALGILFGDHLVKRMPHENLRILADSDRIKKYQKELVYCNDEGCEFHYLSPAEECPPSDLIIFAVKYSGLEDAIQAVKNHIGENTLILSALNGVTSEEVIGRTFGMEKIVHCVAQGMDAVKEGNRLRYHNKGLLCIGDREPGTISPKVKRIADFFEKMEFPFEIDTDMVRRQWGKLMLNVGVNQTVAVYGSNYGEIQRKGQARDTMIAAMREVVNISVHEGFPLTEEDLKYWLEVLGKLSPEGKPSMLQDIEAKRYSEVELFSGTVMALGKKHGIATPVNQELYQRIKALEASF
ncbi:MAG: ketopantoate reductase family protein [Desulfitobacterium sp.]